jgi:Family of unknown function (DUF6163)
MARLRRNHLVFEGGDEAIRDRSGEAPEKRGARWDLVLVWYMRLLALLWIAKGLSAWALILGAGTPVPPFEARLTGSQATVIYFAVIDLIAAVGLWLATVWGGVMWLLAIMSHLILSFFFPSIVPSNTVSTAFFLAFIVAYLVISWLAAGEES